jgi:hypothetical protein
VTVELVVLRKHELRAVWFLNQANSSWLAAVRIGLGGQVVESQALFRSALEYAAYAWHFTVTGICKGCEAGLWAFRSMEGLADSLSTYLRSSYEHVIDFGAHPNERALTSRLPDNGPRPAGRRAE